MTEVSPHVDWIRQIERPIRIEPDVLREEISELVYDIYLEAGHACATGQPATLSMCEKLHALLRLAD